MELALALTVGILFASGVYLVLRRDLIFIALGVALIGNAINLMILVAGRVERTAPALVDDPGATGDVGNPLAQAFILTAIVIGFAVVTLILALACRAARVLRTTDPDQAQGPEEQPTTLTAPSDPEASSGESRD